MIILSICFFMYYILISDCAKNIVLIIADDLDLFLDGMVNI